MTPPMDDTLGLLAELGDALGRAKSLDDALRDTLWRLVEATELDAAALFALAGDSRPYVVASSDDDAPVGVPAGASDAAMLAGTLSADCEREIPTENGGHVWHFPLRSAGAVFGVLEAKAGPQVQPGDVALVRTVAGFIAPALHASELYRSLVEAQRAPDRTRNMLFRRTALEKYREFFKRSADGIAVLDQDGVVLLINPVAQQVTGYATAGIVGRRFVELVAAEDREAFDTLVAAAVEGSPRSLFDVDMVTTSNDTIVVSMSTSLLSEHQDLVVLSFRDITERRYLSDELRRTTSFLERLIDSAYDAIVASDVAGRVVLFNKVAERVFARRAHDVVGQMTVEQLYPAEVLARLRVHLERASEDPPTRQEVLRDEILNAHGDRIPVQISGSVLYEAGVEVGAVVNIYDLRERLRMERQLIQTEERLVETEKQALIAQLAGTTAHELNQPLTSIMGYAELLQRRVPEEDPNHRAAEVIRQESQRMADIVRQIGQITRYQTKPYVGDTQILDLEKSSGDDSSDDDTGLGK